MSYNNYHIFVIDGIISNYLSFFICVTVIVSVNLFKLSRRMRDIIIMAYIYCTYCYLIPTATHQLLLLYEKKQVWLVGALSEPTFLFFSRGICVALHTLSII